MYILNPLFLKILLTPSKSTIQETVFCLEIHILVRLYPHLIYTESVCLILISMWKVGDFFDALFQGLPISHMFKSHGVLRMRVSDMVRGQASGDGPSPRFLLSHDPPEFMKKPDRGISVIVASNHLIPPNKAPHWTVCSTLFWTLGGGFLIRHQSTFILLVFLQILFARKQEF